MAIKLNRFTQDELDDLYRTMDDMGDNYAFEKYCSACDKFDTEQCPHLGKIDLYTQWKHIGCDNFWD